MERLAGTLEELLSMGTKEAERELQIRKLEELSKNS